MNLSKMWRVAPRVAVAFFLCVAAVLPSGAAGDFRTRSFNEMLRIEPNRTFVVDETIQVIPVATGGIGKIDLATAPTGMRPVSFLVTRASATEGGTSTDLKTTENGKSISADLPASLGSGPIQIHLNYQVLGAFTDRAGGTLGTRATMSWDMVPNNWASNIESGTLEVQYPDDKVPIYVGADSGAGASKLTITKTQDTAFAGNVESFNISEGKHGVSMQPPAGIPANAGLHLLISFSRKDLTAAPAQLAAPKAAPSPPKPEPISANRNPLSSTTAEGPQNPSEPGIWPVVLPLLPPFLFFIAYFKRFSFLRGHSFPTSAIPAGIGPAEAGYLLEGALRPRHIIGALAAIAETGFAKKSTVAASETLGPAERRAMEILKQRPNIGTMEEAKSYLGGYMVELRGLVAQNLAARGLLFPTAKRSKTLPALTLVMAMALTAWWSIEQSTVAGAMSSLIGLILSAWLVQSLSPLTQEGVTAYRKLCGLDKFLRAHAQELKDGEGFMDYLHSYAVAFGVVKE